MTRQPNKRSITIARHRTSVSVEEPFWKALAEIAAAKGKTVAAVIGEIDKARSEAGKPKTGLSAAIRLYVLDCTKDRVAAL